MDKGAAAYLSVSAVLCIAISMYCKSTKISKVQVKPEISQEITEITTHQIHKISSADEAKLKSMPVYAEYAFLDDFNIPHVIVKNNTEQIYGYSLSVKYFDESKTEISQKDININSVIPSGMSESPERFIPPFEDAKYISAAVTSYITKDSTITAEPVFNDALCTLAQLKCTDTDAACPLIAMGAPEIVVSKGESDLSDIRFKVTDLSDRPIKNIEFLVAEYAADKKPVSAKPNGYIKENIRKLT